MKIANVMNTSKLGGIEQAFVDYSAALVSKGHQVLAIMHNKTKMKDKLPQSSKLETYLVPLSRYSYYLILPLYFRLKKFAPDLIIIHSKRAIPIMRLVAKMLGVKVVGVAHNPKLKLINKCDAIFSITQHQKNIFADKGYTNVYVVPNLINEKRDYRAMETFHNPPVIGTMGRFDPMKGFPGFIKALAILKRENVPFKAILGGGAGEDGKEEEKLIRSLIVENKLENDVTMSGWIHNKDDFYNNIDVFVLSSNFEPFGIVLLEAMMRSLPVVTTLAEGPSEIFAKHSDAAYTVPIRDYKAMAEAFKTAISDFEQTKQKALKGWQLTNQNYTLDAVAQTLHNAVCSVCGKEN